MHSRLAALNATATAAGMALVVANNERDAEVLHMRERATLVRQALASLFRPVSSGPRLITEQQGTAIEFGMTPNGSEPPDFPLWAWFFRLVEACGITAAKRQEFWEEEVHYATVEACRMYNNAHPYLQKRGQKRTGTSLGV